MAGRTPTSTGPGRVAAALLLAAVASACGQRVAAEGVGRSALPPSVFVVSASGDQLPRLVGRVRAVPGVTAVARVALARVNAAHGSAPAPIVVAAVQPSEFRRLAPAVMDGGAAIAGALARGRLLLASDERARLGVSSGARMRFRGPDGTVAALRVDSLETDSVLNLADGLVSLRGAARLGIGRPTVMLISVPSGPRQPAVVAALNRALQVPQAAPRPVAFLVGSASSRAFGSFWYSSNPDGTISPDPAWVRASIRTRVVPILGSVTCHRLMFGQLVGALREIRRAGLAGEIDVRDFHRGGGCYVPRRQMWDASSPVSMHAWGLAIDLNVRTNPYGARPRQNPQLVAIFERWGFAWGGRWSPPDGMHFQLAALLRS